MDLKEEEKDQVLVAQEKSQQIQDPCESQEDKMDSTSSVKADRAKGSIIAACMGDAAGALLQFCHLPINKKGVQLCFEFQGGGLHMTAPAQVTDDGELTMSLAKGLINGNGVFNLHEIVTQYGQWIKSHPFDIGNTTRNSLGVTTSPYDGIVSKLRDVVKKKNSKSESNGCLMRCTPIGVWGHKLPDQDVFKAGKLDAGLTHCRDEPLQAVGLYVLAIKYLINGASRIEAYSKIKEFAQSHKLAIFPWISIVEANKVLTQIEVKKKCGWVKIAFCFAFHYLKNEVAIQEALFDMLMRGGDTDTNDCIVGGLLGAYHGYTNLPNVWKDKYYDEKKVKQLKSIVRLKTYQLIPQVYADKYVDKLLDLAPESLIISQSPKKKK